MASSDTLVPAAKAAVAHASSRSRLRCASARIAAIAEAPPFLLRSVKRRFLRLRSSIAPRSAMTNTKPPGGQGHIGARAVARVGYGAMQLGPESSLDDAISLLRRAVDLGVNHVDTASFYADG